MGLIPKLISLRGGAPKGSASFCQALSGSNLTQLGWPTTVATIRGHPDVCIDTMRDFPSHSFPIGSRFHLIGPPLKDTLQDVHFRTLAYSDFPSPSSDLSEYYARLSISASLSAYWGYLSWSRGWFCSCVPIGIWSTHCRENSPVWSGTLDPFTYPLIHGYQLLSSPGGGPPWFWQICCVRWTTVLTQSFCMQQTWVIQECYHTEGVNTFTLPTPHGHYPKSAWLRLTTPYLPTLFETILPVMNYILAGEYSCSLQVINTTSRVTSLKPRFRTSAVLSRHPYLTLLDVKESFMVRRLLLSVPFPRGWLCLLDSRKPYCTPPPVPIESAVELRLRIHCPSGFSPRCNPNVFKHSRHGHSGAVDDFRAVFCHVNGLDGFKHEKLY